MLIPKLNKFFTHNFKKQLQIAYANSFASKMKCLLFTFLFMGYHTVLDAQPFELKDISLSWTDFSERPPFASAGHFDANVRYTIKKEYKRKRLNNSYIFILALTFKIDHKDCYVNKEWIKTASPEDKQQLLNHEKVHVINGLIQFKLMQQAMKDYHFSILYRKEADSIFQTFINNANKQNIAYDNNTQHGLDLDRQAIWEQAIMLQFNQIYAGNKTISYEIEIPLSVSY